MRRWSPTLDEPIPQSEVAALPTNQELIEKLKESILEIFSMMTSVHEKSADDGAGENGQEQIFDIEAIVRFHGRLEGYVVLRWSHEGAAEMARGLLMAEPDEELEHEEITDAIGECANMVAGSLKTKALDPIASFSLGIPEVFSPITLKAGHKGGALVYDLTSGVMAAEIWLVDGEV